MRHIFIIGSKGIPSNYGGFETFVEKLTELKKSNLIKYHVSCLSNNEKEFTHNNARCFNIKVPDIGPAKAVYYDLAALKKCIKYIKDNNISDSIIYVLACRIGPFISLFKSDFKRDNITLITNPDGHEWKRAKWNAFIRQYWKVSERLMVKHSDILVCDSKNIEKYIKEDYKKYDADTRFIAYGADSKKSELDNNDEILEKWYQSKGIKDKEYYLVVGRFVPENNYEIMIKEYMKSNTKKDFVLITNIEKNKFYEELEKKTRFKLDKRIKFVGTVYDQELLKKIRENAYGYIHGHEVGGTNPSLLEALATTEMNLLLDVGFNKEVAEDGAFYFNKSNGDLSTLITKLEDIDRKSIDVISRKAKQRIENEYSWELIIEKYEKLFIKKG